MDVVKLNSKIFYNLEDASFREFAEPSIILLTLDNLESCIFKELLSANGELVTYEVLFSYWQNKVVTDGVLSRVISSVRRKLRQLDIETVQVTNVSKKGYKLEGGIEAVQYAVLEVTTVNKGRRWAFLTSMMASMAILAIAFLYYSLSKSETNGAVAFGSFRNVLTNKDVKYRPAFSSTERFVTYSTLGDDNHLFQVVADEQTGNRLNIKDGTNHLFSGIWLGETRLLVYSYNEHECTLKFVDLATNLSNYSLSDFIKCNPASSGNFLHKWSEDEVLYLDSINSVLSPKAFKINVVTGEVEPFPIGRHEGALHAIYGSEGCNLIATLSDKQGATQINVHTRTNLNNLVWSTDVANLLNSIYWDCSKIIYKSKNGELEVVHFLNDEFQNTGSIPVLGTFTGLFTTSNGLALIKGNSFANYIALYSDGKLQNYVPQPLLNQSLPRFMDNDRVLFASDDNGRQELYFIELKTRKIQKFSGYSVWSKLQNLEVSDNGSFIAAETAGNISVLKVGDEGSSLQLIATIQGQKPIFFNDKLIFSKLDGQRSSIYSMALERVGEAPSILVPGGNTAIVKDGKLYFDYWSKLGLWRFDKSGNHELFFQPSFEFIQLVKSDDDFIVKSTQGSYFRLLPDRVEPMEIEGLRQLREIKNGHTLGVAFEPSNTSIFVADWQ